jgi:hypothetical protein
MSGGSTTENTMLNKKRIILVFLQCTFLWGDINNKQIRTYNQRISKNYKYCKENKTGIKNAWCGEEGSLLSD